MRIAIVGAGGVGGYFGARLAAAGHDVRFLARGAHLAAMRENGLRVESALGDLHLHPVTASDRAEDLGPADVVLFSVKLWDTESAAEVVRPLLGPDTPVITFQNGVDSVPRLDSVLGPGHAVGGVCHIAAVIGAPGVIRHTGTLARLWVGRAEGGAGRNIEAFAQAGQAAGVEIEVAPDIRRNIWEKFVFLAPFSGVTSLTRLPIGPIRDDADTRALLRAAVDEAVAVARAEGVELPVDQGERVMAFVDGLPHEMKSSMLGDLERGARLELPWLSGAVVRLGAQHGLPTPTHTFIATALKLHAAGGG